MTTPEARGARRADPSFMPVEGGYLFETPNPWTWGVGRRYVVNEDQKSALLAILLPQRRKVMVLGLIIGCVAAAIAWADIALRHHPDWRDLIGILAAMAAAIYPVGVISRRRYLQRIEPIVSKATPTERKFTQIERYMAALTRSPIAFVLIGAVFWTASTLTSANSILSRSAAQPMLTDWHWYFTVLSLVVSPVFALSYIWALYRRWRAAR